METERERLHKWADRHGLYVRTYSPGDGVTRYRFFHKAADGSTDNTYFGPENGLFTALGLREAHRMLDGYIAGKQAASA